MKKTWKVILLVVSIAAALETLIYKGLEMFSNWHANVKTNAWQSGWDVGFKFGLEQGRRDGYWKLWMSNDISYDRYRELTKD